MKYLSTFTPTLATFVPTFATFLPMATFVPTLANYAALTDVIGQILINNLSIWSLYIVSNLHLLMRCLKILSSVLFEEGIYYI